MTKQSIQELDAEFFGTSELTPSMKQAIQEIWTANAAVDEDQTNGFKHFDGESFAAGKQRLITLTDEVKRKLAVGDATGARSSLGQALHTLQDFYSHSTFIESGGRGALPALWNASIGLPEVAAPEAPTCKPCEGIDCTHNVITPSLTSGYYGGEVEQPAISSKCRHGGPFDSGRGPRGGINKDTLFPVLSEHSHLHGAAARSAREATQQFIRDLKAQLTQSQLELLLGVGPTLAPANAVTLLSVTDVGGGDRRFTLPVDSTLSRVTVSMSGSPSLQLLRPDGSVVKPTDREVEFVSLSTGLVATVLAPKAGLWTITTNPSGAYSLTVVGESPVNLDQFTFVEPRGRPGHQGLFRIQGSPVSGMPMTVAVELSGDIASVQVELRSKAGVPLRTLHLAPDAEGDPLELFGSVELPSTPFVVYALGTLTHGERYQRVIPQVVHPQSVRVPAPPERQERAPTPSP
ncbi:hypothetical protein [Hyalangium rubrum]|nr:hypothetical protein [Hyalangium sp. s54d21]